MWRLARSLLFTFSMTFKAHQVLFLSLLLPLMVTGLAPAQAQLSCKQAYAELKKTDSYGEPILDAVRGLEIEFQKVAEILNKAKELDALEIQIAFMALGPQVEAYFKAAGIPFERSFLSFNVGRTKDSENYLLQYPAYKISGSRSGNELARMMYGIEVSLKSQQYPAAFVFDPLYALNFQGSLGHFRPDVRAILIGPPVLVQSTIGVTNILRHEIHHYLEHLRVLNGQMSLQRMLMLDDQDVSGGNYRKFLSADELETHVRDLRFELNRRKKERIDERLAGLMNEAGRTFLEKERKWAQDGTTENLTDIFKYTKEALPLLFAQAKAGQWKSIEKDEATRATYVFFELKNTEFPNVRVDLRTLIGESSTPTQIQEALVSILEWNQMRVDYLETEFHQLMKKAEQK